MPFSDVIDNYSNGSTGSLTDGDGDTVGYTVTGTSPTTDWNSLDGGARVNANGTQSFTVTFDSPVVGAAMQISGGDFNEIYYIEVNGVVVDLNTLIASGDVTISQSGAQTYTIGNDGSIAGGHYSDGSIVELIFNFPVTSLGAFGTNGGSGNWDYFEVGIDSSTFNVVCFTSGTHITTDAGSTLIEALCVGDFVQTLDNVAKRICWIGSRKFGPSALDNCENLRPVRITAGALGGCLPKQDLLVSRQHRVLVSSKVAERMFGVTNVLIAAIKLTALPGIYVDEDVKEVEYVHLLFDEHEVIFAEGTPSESLYTGPEGMKALPRKSQTEILAIFPELAELNYEQQPACFIPSNKKQKRLVERHVKNQNSVLELYENQAP